MIVTNAEKAAAAQAIADTLSRDARRAAARDDGTLPGITFGRAWLIVGYLRDYAATMRETPETPDAPLRIMAVSKETSSPSIEVSEDGRRIVASRDIKQGEELLWDVEDLWKQSHGEKAK